MKRLEGYDLVILMMAVALTSFGVVVALRELAEQAQEQYGWQIELELPEDDWKLPDHASIALFRITQEALNNAAKYASAKKIRISLICDATTARLEIVDDGIGFAKTDVRPKSHGLAGMRQRMMGLNGSLEVKSEPGHGTAVRAMLPLAELRNSDAVAPA